MPRVRKLLRHIRVEQAKRKRRCYGNRQHAIHGGERCLIVDNIDFPGGKNYCLRCADDILDQAEADIWKHRDKLFHFNKQNWEAYVLDKERNGKVSAELQAKLMSPQSTSMGRAPTSQEPSQPPKQVQLPIEDEQTPKPALRFIPLPPSEG